MSTPIRTRLLLAFLPALLSLGALAWSWQCAANLPEPYGWRAQAGDPELHFFRQEWADFDAEPATVLHRLVTTYAIDRPNSNFLSLRGFAAVAAILSAGLLSWMLLRRADPTHSRPIDRALLVCIVFLIVLHPAFGASWLLGSRFSSSFTLLIFAAALWLLAQDRLGWLRHLLSAALAVTAVALDRSGILVPWALIPAAAASARRRGHSPLGAIALWLLLANLTTLLVRSTAEVTTFATLLSRGVSPWQLLGEALLLPGIPFELRSVTLGLLVVGAAWRPRTGGETRRSDGIEPSLVILGILAIGYAGARQAASNQPPAAEAELWPLATGLVIGLLALAWRKFPGAARRLLLGVTLAACAWSWWQGLSWLHSRAQVLNQASAGLALHRTAGAPRVNSVPVFGRIELLADLLGQGRLPEFSALLPSRFPTSLDSPATAHGDVQCTVHSQRLEGTLTLPWWKQAPGAILVLAWDEQGRSHLVGASLIERPLFSDRSSFSIALASATALPSAVTLQCLALEPGALALKAWAPHLRVGADLTALPSSEAPR